MRLAPHQARWRDEMERTLDEICERRFTASETIAGLRRALGMEDRDPIIAAYAVRAEIEGRNMGEPYVNLGWRKRGHGAGFAWAAATIICLRHELAGRA